VKTGSGAFMAQKKDAVTLAKSLVSVANGAGLRTSALLTDMDEPLASAAGNAVEVKNAADYLTGTHRDPRLHLVALALGAELLVLSKIAKTGVRAHAMLNRALDSGEAAVRFQRMISALGGPHDFVEKCEAHLPKAPIVRAVHPGKSGKVQAIDTRALGLAVIELGGGRRLASDRIDHAVGLTSLAGKGAEVGKERPLAVIHARNEDGFARAASLIRKAYKLGRAPRPRDPVIERIGPR
jgi:thymidine phosphorylase